MLIINIVKKYCKNTKPHTFYVINENVRVFGNYYLHTLFYNNNIKYNIDYTKHTAL